MARSARQRNVVYSTDSGRMCPGCVRPVTDCVCKTRHATLDAESDGVVRLHRERKGRKGAGVTLVRGLPADSAELKKIAKQLRAHAGWAER